MRALLTEIRASEAPDVAAFVAEAGDDEADAEIIAPSVPETTGKEKKKPALPGWMAGCMINADGWPYQNMYNTLWALEHHPELSKASSPLMR